VNAILPKMGINRNTKREVVFGTTKYGVLDVTHLEAVQGYGQFQYLLGHLRSGDTSGTLYRILMEFTQLEYGMEQEILGCDFDKYEKNILTPNWITECWRFLKLCDATIQTTGTWKPIRGRKGARSSKWEWPIQQRPPTAAWKVWNKAFGEAFTEEEDITHQLGEWYDEGGHQLTEWHLDAREGTLYRCKNGKWERHKAKQRGRLRFENECVTVSGPQGITHKAQETMRSRCIEV
jgi:hypothetical protein